MSYKPIYLDRKQVPTHLRGAYTGTHFRVYVTDSVSINSHAMYWDGGSREIWSAVRLADGAAVNILQDRLHPGNVQPENRTIEIPPGVVFRCHHQGMRSSMTFYVRPDDAAPFLPDPAEPLSHDEQIVLAVHCGLKSFARAEELRRQRVSPVNVAAARERLMKLGYLNKAGAVTVSGRNASRDFRLPY